MARMVIIEEPGGPENMKIVEQALSVPGPGEVHVRHEAVGLNFIDVYHRTGLYPLDLPHGLGMEGAGVVVDLADDVTHLKRGDRVAYAATPPGAYCDERVMPAAQVCPLPHEITCDEAAAMMLQGMTVEYLFHRLVPLRAGDRVLFHAAAGGVGLIACQWAKSEGIELIGTASTDEKCRKAMAAGAAHMINYKTENFVDRVREITGGKGVDAVMDGVGKDTFEASLDCLRPVGMMISFGNASGPVPPVNLLQLAGKGSLQVTRTTLFTFLADHAQCQAMAKRLFRKMEAGEVKAHITRRFPLREVAEAHRALEARETTGSTIFMV